MARENTVYLYGRLIADPKNRMDKENNPISSRMILQTLRRSYANDENDSAGENHTRYTNCNIKKSGTD